MAKEKKEFSIDSCPTKPPADILDLGDTRMRAILEVSAKEKPPTPIMQALVVRIFNPSLKKYQADFQRIVNDLLSIVKTDLKKNDLASARHRTGEAGRKLDALIDALPQFLEKATLKELKDHKLDAKVAVRVMSGYKGIEFEEPRPAPGPANKAGAPTAATKPAGTLLEQAKRCVTELAGLMVRAESLEKRRDALRAALEKVNQITRAQAIARLKPNDSKEALYNLIKSTCDQLLVLVRDYQQASESLHHAAVAVGTSLVRLMGMFSSDKVKDPALIQWARKELPRMAPLNSRAFSDWVEINRALAPELKQSILDRSRFGDPKVDLKRDIQEIFSHGHFKAGPVAIKELRSDSEILKRKLQC